MIPIDKASEPYFATFPMETNNRKISMTVPVIQELAGEQMKIAFVVPKEQWENIPEPTSPWLTVKKFDSGLFAVIQLWRDFER